MTARLLHEPGPGLGFVDVVAAFTPGSETDPAGLEGVAQLTMRLVRAGPKGRTRAEVDAEVERLGAHLEAGVGQHRCMVRGRVLRENLEPFARLLAEIVTEPALRADDFERAKRLLAAELVSVRDDDQGLAARAFRRSLFRGNAAGRPSSGTVASVGRITLDDCAAWYRASLAADRLIVGVAGDLTEEEGRRLVAGPLGALPVTSAKPPHVEPPAAPKGRRALLVDKPDRTQTQILLGHLGPRPARPDHMGMLVSSVAFGGTFSGRMMQEVRVKRGWSYGAYSRLTRSRHDDAWYLWTFPAAKDAGPCLALQFEMLEALARDGVTQEELDFAKGYLVGSSVFHVDTPADRLERRLEVETLGFPHDYWTGFRKRVEAVGLAEAHRATGPNVHPADLVVAVLGTVSEIEKPIREALGPGAVVETVAFDDADL